MLFNVKNDPDELENLIEKYPEKVVHYKALAAKIADPIEVEKVQRLRARNAKWFSAYEQRVGFDDTERWQGNPPSARGVPKVQ